MPEWQYTKGLHDIGNGLWAYLQPDGGWCLNNAGLIVDSGQALLVDTLTDVPLTQEMLASMRRATCSAERIGTVVNTHSHPDHTAGNRVLEGAEIIASAAAAEEMKQFGKSDSLYAKVMHDWQNHGEAGRYLHDVMGSRFELADMRVALPTRTFEHQLDLRVGTKEVRLVRVGPAHTVGDVLVHVPGDRVVFTGDILFNRVHPVVSPHLMEWVRACDLILSWDVDVVVPGHGPITDKSGVRALKSYLLYFYSEARARYDAGMSFEKAVRDISLESFRGWPDEERVISNVAALYRQFGAQVPPPLDVLAMAGRYRREKLQGQRDMHAVDRAGSALQ